MTPKLRKSLLRIGVQWAWLGVALLVGVATSSVHVFVAVMAVGLVVTLALRFTVLR